MDAGCLVYLGSPFSSPDPAIKEERFLEALRAAAHLMRNGYTVFSPIAHSHPIAQHHDLPKSWEFWRDQDFPLLEKCDELYVLVIDGWGQSRGVTEEMERAGELNLPVTLMYPDGDGYVFRTYSRGSRG